MNENETTEALRALAAAIVDLAVGTVAIIGTMRAGEIIAKVELITDPWTREVVEGSD